MKLRFVDECETETVAIRKKRLRLRMKERRADNENRDVKEALLIDNFCRLYEGVFGESIGAGTKRTLFIYLSFSSEAPTHRLIETLLECGHTVCAPRVEDGQMTAVEICEETDFMRSDFGAVEPIGSSFAGEIDMAIVPLLAVDKQGNRLGYGGGYYDSFLGEYPQIKRVGYAFDFQLLPSVPCEEKDIKMQYIVTDKRIVAVGNERER